MPDAVLEIKATLNVTLIGIGIIFTAAAAVAAVLFGARQAGRHAEGVERMRRTWRCKVISSRLRAVVLAIAASLLAGCATERSDSASCPPIVAYSRDFLAHAADERASLPAGAARREAGAALLHCAMAGGAAVGDEQERTLTYMGCPPSFSCGQVMIEMKELSIH